MGYGLMPGLKASRQLLAQQIDAAVVDTDVDVLPFDPPTITAPAVTVATANVTPTTWTFIIRVYMDAGQSEQAQDFLDDLVETIDLTMDDAVARATAAASTSSR